MTAIHWLPEAKADLERLHAFIRNHNPRAALEATQTIVSGVEQLSDFPELGRPWTADMNYRELVIPYGARSYVVRYRLFHDGVVVVRVWHGLEARK